MCLLALRLFLRNGALSSSGTEDAFPNTDREDALAHLHLYSFSSSDEGLVGTDLCIHLATRMIELRPGYPGQLPEGRTCPVSEPGCGSIKLSLKQLHGVCFGLLWLVQQSISKYRRLGGL